jgi:hypothetical protein
MWKRVAVYLGMSLLMGCVSPTPVPGKSPLVSPLNLPAASPISTPGPTLVLNGPNFEVSPIKAADKVVSGHGPSGIPIVIVDVTLSAKVLGNGKIDGQGNFSVGLSRPLIESHLIGIQVIDLAGTPYDTNNEIAAALDAKAGPGFQYYPMIGTVYAQIKVEP